MSDYLNKIVYLSKEQYQSLLDSTSNPKSIQVNGNTYQYDANSLYITNDKGDADTVNGHSVYHDVPFDAVFTDTNVYHTSGDWDNLTYTARTIGGTNNASQYELSFTLPTTLNANFILQRTDDTLLGINTTTYQIGTNVKSLHFNQVKGNGTGLTNGNGGGITFGNGSNSYGGMYWQTSGNYGSRLYFATTTSFANGAYARMIITPAGYVGIGKLEPSTLLDVNGTVTATSFSGNLSGNASTSTSWANARKVYAALGTASTTTTINGGASDAAAIGIGVDGTLGINNGGTGITTTDPHTVLIGPSGGTTKVAPTWRTLVASDLPVATSDSLGIVKIGSGITNTNGEISVTASNLGLSQALKFVGITNTDMTGGTATNNLYTGVPGGITSYTTPAVGDVVINNTNNDEWVCTIANGASSKWERLGSDTSYKIVQTAITDNTGTADSTNTSTSFIYSFSQDANGVVSVKTRTLNTNGTWNGNADTATSTTYIQGIDHSGSNINIATIITNPENGKIKYNYCIGLNSTGLFAHNTTSNTNAIITLSTGSTTNYFHQLGLSTNKHLYHRAFINEEPSNDKAWNEILDSSNYTDYAAAAGHTHNYAGSSSAGGAATTVTTANSNAALYLVGVASDATTSLKYNSDIVMDDGTLSLTNIQMSGDTSVITRKIPAWTGGWARPLISVTANDGTALMSASIFGNAQALNYIYIGTAAHNSTDNIRFYTGGKIMAKEFQGNLTGNAATASKLNTNELTNQDLNDYKDDSTTWYFAGGDNSVANKPTGVTSFGLYVYRNASAYRAQELYSSAGAKWIRYWNNGAWTEWEQMYGTLHKPTAADIGAATTSHAHGNITNDGKMSGSTVSGAVTTSHKFLREDGTWVVPKYTSNTHYTTKLIAGGSSATSNATVSSGNVYLRLFDDNTHRNDIQLKASTAMTITSDANGIITFTSSDTNNAATHTLAKTTKYYVTGTTSTSTTTAGDSFDTGVYVTAVEGELSAVRHSYNVGGTEKAYTYYNTSDDSIDFIFI